MPYDIKNIPGSQCIGDSLQTINNNFTNIANTLSGFNLEIDALLNAELQPAGTGSGGILGGVRVGNGLTVTPEGLISTDISKYTFTGGITISDSQIISLDYDTTRLALSGNKLTVTPTAQENWVVSTSAKSEKLFGWFNSTSASLVTQSALTSSLQNAIPKALISTSTWVINNSAKIVNDLSYTYALLTNKAWVDDHKNTIILNSSWIASNSSITRGVNTWVSANSSLIEKTLTGTSNSTSGGGIILTGTGIQDEVVRKIIFTGDNVNVTKLENGVARVNITSSTTANASIIKNIINCFSDQLEYYIEGFTNTYSENYIVTQDGRVLTPDIDYTVQVDKIVLSKAPPNDKLLVVLSLQNKLIPTSSYTPSSNIGAQGNLSLFGDNLLLSPSITGINVTGVGINATVQNNVATISVNRNEQQVDTSGGIIIGTMMCFPSRKVPTGWLLCDGGAIDIVANAKYAKLAAELYCGDSNNNLAEYGFRSNAPTLEGDHSITIQKLFSEKLTNYGTADDGAIAISVAGGSGSYAFRVGTKQTNGSSDTLLTITNLNSGNYECSLTDTILNKTILFNLTIGYSTQPSFITYNGNMYNINTIFHSTSRSVDGRYLYLPDMTKEMQSNKALFYCIKY